MALFNKNINIIMTDDYTPNKKINVRVVAIIATILLMFTIFFVNIDINGKIDIEGITIEQLQDIPTIGPDKSILIYEYIQENGFNDYEDLLIIDGVGPETIKKLKKYTRR